MFVLLSTTRSCRGHWSNSTIAGGRCASGPVMACAKHCDGGRGLSHRTDLFRHYLAVKPHPHTATVRLRGLFNSKYYQLILCKPSLLNFTLFDIFWSNSTQNLTMWSYKALPIHSKSFMSFFTLILQTNKERTTCYQKQHLDAAV